MLDIKKIREEKDIVLKNLHKRGDFDVKILDEILELDSQWREGKTHVDKLKSEKNKASQEIGKIKKEGGDASEVLKNVQAIAQEIEAKENDVDTLLEKRNELLSTIPNMLDEAVPTGEDDEDNVPIRTWGEKPEFSFKPKTHQELCEMNNWYDLKRAAKYSGARFYYMKNELVMLEMALYQFVLNKLQGKGFELLEVPVMLKADIAKQAIPLADFEDTIYKIENDGDELYLIGTSEHAMAVFHSNEILNHTELPKMYAGVSPCYRREAGVTKDEKGIFRVHNFNKIEQFVYCAEEDSDKFHDMITANIEEIFQELELHYQMVDICTGDIGIFATRKYDLEAWLPGQDKYREMGSSSNYRDYGARSLNVRYQSKENETKFCHTLNNTAIAMQRAIIALIEQHQREDGNVTIPKALQPYLGGKELLIEK